MALPNLANASAIIPPPQPTSKIETPSSGWPVGASGAREFFFTKSRTYPTRIELRECKGELVPLWSHQSPYFELNPIQANSTLYRLNPDRCMEKLLLWLVKLRVRKLEHADCLNEVKATQKTWVVFFIQRSIFIKVYLNKILLRNLDSLFISYIVNPRLGHTLIWALKTWCGKTHINIIIKLVSDLYFSKFSQREFFGPKNVGAGCILYTVFITPAITKEYTV